MATSGTLSSSKYGDRYLKFTWERTGYNASKKQSTIKWSLKGAGGSGYYKAGNFLVKIDGDKVYETDQDDRIELRNGTTVKTGTKTITHGSTGTKSFKVYIEAGIYTYAVNCDGEKTFTLDPFYDIKFNANGGSGAPTAQTKMYGVNLTLSSTKPTKAGYTFLGWGTGTSDTTVDYSAGGTYTSNASTTLYAIWSKQITLSYNANGGSGVPNSQSATVYNATTSYEFTIPKTVPKKDGHVFLGYSTSNSATSATYLLGEKIKLSTSDILYAVWSPYKHTVKYNANGGTNTPKEQVKTYGGTIFITDQQPERVGYTFKNWNTEPDGSGTPYNSGQEYGYDQNGGTVILYAQWKKISLTVTLNASTNGGAVNGLASTTKSVYYNDSIGALPNAEKKNYKFLGWFTEPSGGTKITSNLIITSNRTFYAQFELQANCYTKQDSYIEAMMYRKINGVYKTGVVKVRKNGVYSDISM